MLSRPTVVPIGSDRLAAPTLLVGAVFLSVRQQGRGDRNPGGPAPAVDLHSGDGWRRFGITVCNMETALSLLRFDIISWGPAYAAGSVRKLQGKLHVSLHWL